MKIRFESVECARCGGTGHHSYNQVSGSICFDCHGRRRTLTTAGRAARRAYDALLDERMGKPAEEVAVGQKVYREADGYLFPRSGYVEVTGSRREGASRWRLEYALAAPGALPRSQTLLEGMRLLVLDPQVQGQVMEEIARDHPGATLTRSAEEERAAEAAEQAKDAEREQRLAKRRTRAAAVRAAKDAERAAADGERRQGEDGRKDAERQAWRTAHPDLAAALDAVDPTGTAHPHLAKFATRARTRALSPKETAYAARLLEREAADAARRAASLHLGAVGERVSLTATLAARIELGKDNYSNHTKYLIIMTESATGATLKTFTTGTWHVDVEQGETFAFSAIIEAHETRKGERETRVKDVRLKRAR